MGDVAERVGDHWYLRPVVGAGTAATERLIRWWWLLYGLSSLARYQPAEWTQALDVDASALAVDLERGLRVAQSTLPELISKALGSSGAPPRPLTNEGKRAERVG
jgi:hypothetical protein